MFRDFSDAAKERLLGYIDESTPTQSWDSLADVLSGLKYSVWEWLLQLNLTNSISDVENYQQQMIEKHDTSVAQIEKIFTDVNTVDGHYGTSMAEVVEQGKQMTKFINDLAESIDPSGGNFNIAYMDGILAADKEAIETGKTSMDAVIEQEMLGAQNLAAQYKADPVNMSTGNFIYDHEDLSIKGEIPLSFHRYYNSKDQKTGALGKCFLHNYEITLDQKHDGTIGIRMSDGQELYFEKSEAGTFLGKNTALEILEETDHGYALHKTGINTMHFSKDGKLLRIEATTGLGITFTYNEKKQLKEARSDNGSTLTYAYDAQGMLIKVTDHTGREINLSYENRLLTTVVLPSGAAYTYRYTQNGRIEEIINPRDVIAVRNQYDSKHRITHQTMPDGSKMQIRYDDDNNRVIFTERNGRKTIYVHDDKYRNTETIYEDGTKERYLYNDKNQCISMTDRNGHTKRMAYDRRGNLAQLTDAAKRRINMTYDTDNHLVNVSINGKERLKNYYDAKGNLIGTENIDGSGVKITNDAAGRPVEIRKPDGSSIELSYDDRGNLNHIKDAFGGKTQYQYDTLNRVEKTIDANGNQTAFYYDMADRIVKVTNAQGSDREYQYNASGKVTEIRDYDGYSLHADYNTLGRLESVTDKEGNVMRYTYDKMWNIASQTMPDGGITTFFYDNENHLTEQTLPEGGSIQYEYDAVGNRIGMTDAEGNHTAFTYDAVNRLIEVTEADGAKTIYAYDTEGNLATVTNALGQVTAYTYDEMGRRTSVTDAQGNTTSVCYNTMGNVERICYPNGSSTRYTYEAGGRVVSVTYPTGASEHYTYDPNGNLIRRANGRGEAIEIKYDCLNRVTELTNPMGGVRHYAYDAVGNITEMTDENGNKTTYQYSPNGNLINVTDALGNETAYTYDSMGHLTETICAGNREEEKQTTTYTWNLAGNVTEIKDPLGDIEQYTYDKNGRMRSKTDKDGYATSFNYDSAGQLTQILYADGREVAFSYNALRQLEEMKDWLGSTKIVLDELGRALSITDAEGKAVGYEWGSMGEKCAMTYPDGKRATYEYNDAMQLIALHMGEDTVSYTYDELGRLTTKALPGETTTTYAYNELGRLASIRHQGASVNENYIYQYDPAGNKIRADKQRIGVKADNGSFDYTYDTLNRLAQVHKDGNILREYSYDAFGNRVQKLDYSKSHFGSSSIDPLTTVYHYNTKNQLISETDGFIEKHYQYDHRGNLTAVRSGEELLKQFAFDAANQMSSSYAMVNGVTKQASYTYNGLGQRVGQDIWKATGEGIRPTLPENPEQKIRYALDLTRQYHNLLERSETNEGVAFDKNQTFFWDGNVVGMEAGDTKNFYLQDDLGSAMQLLDEAGDIRESYAYDEFGANVYTAKDIFTSPMQPFGYTGYQMDAVGGLYFAQARRYDAGVGRFVSEDIVKGSIVAPFTMNHYGYCWNRPMDLVDLNGMWPEWAKTVVKVGAAVALTAAVVVAAPIVAGAVASAAVAIGASTAVGAGIATVVTATTAGAVVAGGTSWVNQAVDNGIENVDYRKMGLDAASGAIKAGTLATIAVSGGTVGLGSKILVNGVVDVGEKIIESNMNGQDITGGEIALIVGESIFSTVLFHSADKLLSGAKSNMHEYIRHKQNAWDAKWWIFARNLTEQGVGVSNINSAFRNIDEGCSDFYEYELIEVLRKYIVQNAVNNDKSLMRNEILERFNVTPSDLFNTMIEALKSNVIGEERKGGCESE